MKLTKKDYDWCYKKMKHWQNKLGMNNYRFTMHFNFDTACAQCEVNIQSCTAKLSLSTTNYWNNKKEIEKSIFHEVAETMLYTQFGYHMSEFYSDDFIEGKTHEVVRRLENLMFD